MTELFDDGDISDAYDRLLAGVEAPSNAAAQVARRRVQRMRRHTAVAGVAVLATVAALGIGGSLVLGGSPDPQSDVAVDPAGPDSSSVVQPAPLWPTEVTCDDGAQPLPFAFDSSLRPLTEIAAGQGPVHFDRATFRLFQLRADRTAYRVLQLEAPDDGSYFMGSGSECRDRAKPVVSNDLDCPAGQQNLFVARSIPIPGQSAIEAAETWSGGNLVALNKDGVTAHALRPDGSTYATLSLIGNRDAHNISAATYCEGEGRAPGPPVDSDGWPTDISCAAGQEIIGVDFDSPGYPSFAELLDDLAVGLAHHDPERGKLFLLRPDKTAYSVLPLTNNDGRWFADGSRTCEGEVSVSVSDELTCPTELRNITNYYVQPISGRSALRAAEGWSRGDPVALGEDGRTAYVLREDGTIRAKLSVVRDSEASAVDRAEFCGGEGRDSDVDAGEGTDRPWPTDVTCPEGRPSTVIAYSPTRYSTFTAFLRGERTGAIHHSDDRTTLFFLRPDGTAYRKIATQGAANGWNPGKITACDLKERLETPEEISCPGPVMSRQYESFAGPLPEGQAGLSILEAGEAYGESQPVALAEDGRTVQKIRPDGTISAELLIEGNEKDGYGVSADARCADDPFPSR